MIYPYFMIPFFTLDLVFYLDPSTPSEISQVTYLMKQSV